MPWRSHKQLIHSRTELSKKKARSIQDGVEMSHLDELISIQNSSTPWHCPKLIVKLYTTDQKYMGGTNQNSEPANSAL